MRTITPILIIALALSGCDKKSQTTPTEPVVHVAYPKVGHVKGSYNFPAYLDANQQVNLVARVSGTLEKVEYPIGGSVKEGNALFVIEPQKYKDIVASSEAQVQSATAQLQYAKSNYERMERSSKSNAVSQNDLQQAKSSYLQAQAALNQANSQLSEASLNLSYCYITAPFTGQISKNTIDAGNYLNGGETLATIYDESKLTVEFNMGYKEFINLPQPVEGTVAEIFINGDTIPATLQYVAPAVNLQTGSMAAQAIIDNSKYNLKSGVFVNISIPYRSNESAVIIPLSCVGTSLDKRFVYTLNSDNSVTVNEVTIGETLPNGMVEIINGLSANQLYLIDALTSIRTGMKVKPVITK